MCIFTFERHNPTTDNNTMLILILAILILVAAVMRFYEKQISSRNIPFLSFISNHCILLCVTCCGLALALYEPTFHEAGALVYIPVMFLSVVSFAMLVVHLAFPGTIETYLHSGKLIEEFNGLEPKWRAAISTFVIVGLIVAFSAIAAALAK